MKRLIVVCILFAGMLMVTSVFAQDSEQGDLWAVTVEKVLPADLASYEEWSKGYVDVAKNAELPVWFAFSENGEYVYASNIGKTIDGREKEDAAWKAAFEANPKLAEMWEKYSYTVHTKRQEIWRHEPSISYNPETESGVVNTYTRIFKFWIKPEKISEATELMKGYVSAWKNAALSPGFNVYSSVSGEDQNVWQIRVAYEDAQHWAESDKVNNEKLGDSTDELWSKWTKVINKMETYESWNRNDLSSPVDDSE
jgi:hypothetical protein